VKRLIVSACLVGFDCKYNGGNNRLEAVVEAFKRGLVVPVCPEQLGGLPTPRPPAKIRGGCGSDVLAGKARVITVDGRFKDVTDNFLRGAYQTLYAAELLGSGVAACILKEKSPSCGVRKIYNFDDDTLREGMGVTAALLSSKGFKILSSEETEEIEKLIKELQ
jgi:uncharacterized protein YbbK (DUF523 family)